MQINVVELLRVYGELQSPSLPASVGLQLELERKDFELEQMRERVADLKTREQQANEERLRIFGLLEQQTRLLAAPIAAANPKAAAKRSAKTVPNKVVRPAPKVTTARKTVTKPVTKAPSLAAARSKTTARTAPKAAEKSH